MSEQIKAVTGVVKDVAAMTEQAKQVAADLHKNIGDVNEALGMVSELSASLRSAGAELRGVLGTQTNSPPPDEQA